MKTTLNMIARASRGIGYKPDAIIRDYTFTDFAGPAGAGPHTAPLAVFTQTPVSYRSAAFAAAEAQANGPQATVDAFRALGAPLFFLIEGEAISIWQIQADAKARLLERTSLRDLPQLFTSNSAVWAPDAIHRAKSVGRFNASYQLDFVDVGLIPAIEGQVHGKLDRLITDTLEVATPKLGRNSTLFQGVFRLLAAKILTDRQHPVAQSWLGGDVCTVLQGIGKYYGLAEGAFGSDATARKFERPWQVLTAGVNVSNISADDLAFVYENTLVTPETRLAYGTHSTPRHVAEYVVSRLGLGSGEHPPTVFEPFAGAGVFLVSALRHMREALPYTWGDSKRHSLLVKRIFGAEIDAFACEVAVLSLILADYPNTNGWHIENLDLLASGNLAARLAGCDVVLCNPPFEIFTDAERVAYPEIVSHGTSKADAVFAMTLKRRPRALGFVLPSSLLMGRSYREHRKQLEMHYREVELVSLPDGIFSVSQVESALVIARDPLGEGQKQVVRASEVYDKDRSKFAYTGMPSTSREIVLAPREIVTGDLWVPRLHSIWKRVSDCRTIGDYVVGHWGIRWKDGKQSSSVFSEPGPGRVRGLAQTGDHRQFATGREKWLDFRAAALYGGRSFAWDEPKLLCNAARLSRGYWRLAAAVDRSGLVASQQFVAFWPVVDDVDLETLAAVLNGPLANAFITERSTEGRFRIEALHAVPVPSRMPDALRQLVADYVAALKAPDVAIDDAHLGAMLDAIDEAVLDAYDLPPRMVRDLLSAFTDSPRPLRHDWLPWNIVDDDPAVSLAEWRSGVVQKSKGDWVRTGLTPVTRDEAAAIDRFMR